MKLVLVHYHLNRGGVSQVIANHLRALDRVLDHRLEVFVLSGPRALGWPRELAEQLERIVLQRATLAGLDYEELTTAEQRRRLPEETAELLRQGGFSPGETVVHIHNHSLGKNSAMPHLVGELARRGFGLVLHVHDFAEDCRPENYQRLRDSVGAIQPQTPGVAWAYPQAPHVHYAVLNDRDYHILARAGVPEHRLHLLPNPVLMPHVEADRRQARQKLQARFDVPPEVPFLLYPVRGIARKNLGEMLLWSLTAPDGGTVGITLAPINPAQQPRYQSWVELSRRLGLPVVFECGEAGGLSFAENLAAADALLNTSVAEGFGMVFLESALFGRELWGRDLPEITRSFAAHGVRWPRLVPKVEVHSTWFNHRRWQQVVQQVYQETVEQYGLSADGVFPHWQTELLEKFPSDGWGDFADLDPEGQRQVLSQLRESPAERESLLKRNPLLYWDPGESTQIEQCAQAVQKHYSLEPSGRRLLAMYASVLESARGELVPLDHAERILTEFLAPGRFRLIRM